MPDLVRERLYLGDINDAVEILKDEKTEFKFILSLLSSPSISIFTEWHYSTSLIPHQEFKKVFKEEEEEKGKLLYLKEFAGKELKLVRMAVPFEDIENENLLDSLEFCLDFIEESRKEGSILVHCFAGVSRSASIILAYLMRREQLSRDDALESLRQSRDIVCPNKGFLNQLKMFEEMGFKIDHGSSTYKRFHLKILSDIYKRGEKIDISRFGVDPGVSPTTLTSSVSKNPNGAKSKLEYRCIKCRRIVAKEENIMGHTPGENETCSNWIKTKSIKPVNKSYDQECSSIFVEPLQWMNTVSEGGMEGKLSCVGCEARLGHFNWSGIQCNCGSLIVPAFQLQKSRVDLASFSIGAGKWQKKK